MPELTLSPGESRKIVSQPERGEEYNLHVTGTNVFISHNNRAIRQQGDEVVAGDRVTLDEFRGSSAYAKNPTTNTQDATLNISEASFSITYETRSILGAVRSAFGNKVLPATDDYSNITKTADLNNGDISVSLGAPGRAEKVSVRAEGSAAFDLTVAFGNTAVTFSGDGSTPVSETVPVFYLDDQVDITVTDTSGGANDTDVDAAVI